MTLVSGQGERVSVPADRGEAASDVLAASDIAYAVTDTRNTMTWVNPALCKLLGLDADGCAGRSLTALLAGAPEGPNEGVIVYCPDVGGGQHRWLDVSCTALDAERLLYRITDVTRWRDRELSAANLGIRTEDLLRMVEEDPLTGLPNRRALTRALEHELATGRGGALLLLDLDNFKDINDLHGHPTGDRVMCTLARLLRDHLGTGDNTLGRLGGDEFAVVLGGATEQDAVAVADRMRGAVAASPLVGGYGATRTTISAGVVGFGSGETWQAVLANADLALYASKDAGRNRVTVYERGHYMDTAMRVSVLDRVRAALVDGNLSLHAMPMVKLNSGRVTGHELLLRLEDGRSPYLGPGEFLPAVERGDLVFDIDRWVVGTAIDTLVEHPYPGLRFNVNVSGRTLEDEDFGDFVLDRLAAAGVAPGRLGFEITETAAVTNLDAARRLSQRLRTNGCRITLDDFGSGFGSFVHLKQLPITGLKIDGEFVKAVDYSSRDIVLVQGLVDIARSLGLSVVAEWVERPTQVDALRRLGVRVAQGFHLGRPIPLEELLAKPLGQWSRRPQLMEEAGGEGHPSDAR